MTDRRPRILLSTASDAAPWYSQAITAAGGQPIGGYLPEPDLSCDGLLLCGGGDILPALFGQENQGSDPPEPGRDELELPLAREFLRMKKPVMGICRGMQVINVALGGDLIQDLPAEIKPFHGGTHFVSHLVRARSGCLFESLYGPVFPVNSFHHQAVGRLGRGLYPVLWSEGGVVEGMLHESLPLLAVQFHPERMTGAKLRPDTVDGAPLFRHFLSLFH